MKRWLVILLLFAAGCAKPAQEAPKGKVAADVADQGPRLVGNPPTVQIELPPRMTAALAAIDSGFVTLTPFDFVPEIVPGDSTDGAWRYSYNDRESPFAVIGDFDGDGRKDVALLQRSTGPAFMKAEGRVVVIFDRTSGAVAATATSWNFPFVDKGSKSGFYLTTFRPGPYTPPDFGGSGQPRRTINFPYEGIQLSNYGKTATTYWWTREGDFESAATAD